jgi:hypothetical protein
MFQEFFRIIHKRPLFSLENHDVRYQNFSINRANQRSLEVNKFVFVSFK